MMSVRRFAGWESLRSKSAHRARWRIVLELTLGRWFAPYHPPSGFIFGQTFTLEQKLYQPHGIVTYVRDEYGLRGARKGSRENRGCERRWVHHRPDSSSPRGRLGRMSSSRRRAFALRMPATEGISSTGHVVAVVEWLHRIPSFRPRFYLHYIGLNDAAFAQAWTRPGSKGLIEAQIADQENRRAPHRFIRGRSALVQGFIALKSWIGGPPRVFTASQLNAIQRLGRFVPRSTSTDRGVREAHL